MEDHLLEFSLCSDTSRVLRESGKCVALIEAGGTSHGRYRVLLEAAGCSAMGFVNASSLACAMREGQHLDAILVVCDGRREEIRGAINVLRDADRAMTPVLLLMQEELLENCFDLLDEPGVDFVLMPCRMHELRIRIAASLGLMKRGASGPLRFGRYQLIPSTHTVLLDDTPIKLAPKAFDLALFLFRRMGNTHSREAIYESVWGGRPGTDRTRSLDVLIAGLRRTLRFGIENGIFLLSTRGVGYGLFFTSPLPAQAALDRPQSG